MTETFKKCLWANFGAAIDMLINAIELCPDELWNKERKFFFLAYHTTIFLDFYLSWPVSGFHPCLPYTIGDETAIPRDAIDDVIPERLYDKKEMLDCLAGIREKCKNLIAHATEDSLNARWITDNEIGMHGLCPRVVKDYTVLEILFYNLRHVQHHVAQLNVILRQHIDRAPDWVARVGD